MVALVLFCTKDSEDAQYFISSYQLSKRFDSPPPLNSKVFKKLDHIYWL